MKTSSCVLLGLVLAGCGGAPPTDDGAAESALAEGAGASNANAATTTQYTDLADFSGIDQGAWFSLTARLAGEFNDACGDAFCEGDYANLTPLTLNCTVTSKTGSIHDCAWTFAGSLTSVDPKTAAVTISAPTFQCHVHPKTTAAKLIALLTASSDALHETLPGTTGSLYDELVDCFQHPIGATPITFPNAPSPTYVDAATYFTTAKGQATWQSALAAAKKGFDDLCGDTFCGSDYSDLSSLELVCAVTRSTGNVKSCAWVFGGSVESANKNGSLDVTSKSFACNVPVKGTIEKLAAVLDAPGSDNPIQRALPGETTSAYDALGGCLP